MIKTLKQEFPNDRPPISEPPPPTAMDMYEPMWKWFWCQYAAELQLNSLSLFGTGQRNVVLLTVFRAGWKARRGADNEQFREYGYFPHWKAFLKSFPELCDRDAFRNDYAAAVKIIFHAAYFHDAHQKPEQPQPGMVVVPNVPPMEGGEVHDLRML